MRGFAERQADAFGAHGTATTEVQDRGLVPVQDSEIDATAGGSGQKPSAAEPAR